jgi:hypothetical protein
MIKAEINSIDEELLVNKSRVKGFLRTRKGKLERVKEFERKSGLRDHIRELASKSKSDLKSKIDKLEFKINRIMNRAHRASMRYDDAGPLDIAYEKVEPLQHKILLMKHALSGKGSIPKPVVEAWESLQESKKYQDEDKEERKKRKQEAETKIIKIGGKKYNFKDLVNKVVTWSSKKNPNGKGIVVKVNLLKERVKLDNGWAVPIRMLKTVKASSGGEKVAVRPKELIGKKIEWISSKTGETHSGIVISAGSERVKTDNHWTTPLSLVTKVGSKPFSIWR